MSLLYHAAEREMWVRSIERPFEPRVGDRVLKTLMNTHGTCFVNATMQLLMNVEPFVSTVLAAARPAHDAIQILHRIVHLYQTSPDACIDIRPLFVQLRPFIDADLVEIVGLDGTRGYGFLILIFMLHLVDTHLQPGFTDALLTRSKYATPDKGATVFTYEGLMRSVRGDVRSAYHICRFEHHDRMCIEATADEWNHGCVVGSCRMQIIAFNTCIQHRHLMNVSFLNGRWILQNDHNMWTVDVSTLHIMFTMSSIILIHVTGCAEPFDPVTPTTDRTPLDQFYGRFPYDLRGFQVVLGRNVFAVPHAGEHLYQAFPDAQCPRIVSSYTMAQMGRVPAADALPANVSVCVGPHVCQVIHSFQETLLLRVTTGDIWSCSPIQLPSRPGDAFLFAGRRGCWFARMMTLAALRSAYAHRGANVLRPLHVGDVEGTDAWVDYRVDDVLEVSDVEKAYIAKDADLDAAPVFERATVVVFGYVLGAFLDTYMDRLSRVAALVNVVCIPCFESHYHFMHERLSHIFMSLMMTFTSGLQSRNMIIYPYDKTFRYVTRSDIAAARKLGAELHEYANKTMYVVSADNDEFMDIFLRQHAFLQFDARDFFRRFELSFIDVRPRPLVSPPYIPPPVAGLGVVRWTQLLVLDACSQLLGQGVQFRPVIIFIPRGARIECECASASMCRTLERHLPARRDGSSRSVVTLEIVNDPDTTHAIVGAPPRLRVPFPYENMSVQSRIAFARTLAACIEYYDASHISVITSRMFDEYDHCDRILRRFIRPGARCVFPFPDVRVMSVSDTEVALSDGSVARIPRTAIDWSLLPETTHVAKRGHEDDAARRP